MFDDLWTIEDWNSSQESEFESWERVEIVSEKEARAKRRGIEGAKIDLYTPYRFEWTGSLDDYIGQEIVGSDYAIAAVFPKREVTEKLGEHVVLMCVSTWGF